jgi:hypothetical protein
VRRPWTFTRRTARVGGGRRNHTRSGLVVARFQIVDHQTVRDADGREYDVLEAIKQLPWVSQLCPQMPHDYASPHKSDRTFFDVLDTMVSSRNADTYLAYFRGYPTPNRYWEGPDGKRYWRTRELNRCDPGSVEPLRRKDQGATAAKEWDGPPWAPSGIGTYQRDAKGGWWPTQAALANGYQPCRACQRRPKDLAGG